MTKSIYKILMNQYLKMRKVLFELNKNILLKGPTGSGKQNLLKR